MTHVPRVDFRPATAYVARCLHVLLVFVFLYTPFLRIGGFTVHLPYLVVAALAAYFLWMLAVRGVARAYLCFMLAMMVGYGWILAVSLTNGALDFNIQLVYLNGFATMAAAYALVRLIQPAKVGERPSQTAGVSFAIFVAGVLHAFVMAVVFFVPRAADALYSVVILGDRGQSFVEQVIRSPGLTTGGGDALSVIQAIALVFGVQSVVTMKKPLMLAKLALYVIAFLLLLLSILLSARTGFVVAGTGLGLLGVRYGASVALAWRLERTTLLKLGTVMIGIVAVGVPLYWALASSEYSRFVGRAFEPFVAYAETGRLATTSSDRIVNTMYFLPESDRHRVVGTGNFGRDTSLPTIPSDVGYVRTIFGAGLVGTVLIYGALLFPLVVAMRRARFDPHAAWLISFLVIAILLVNVKVFHFAGMRESFKALCLMFSAAVLTPRIGARAYVRSALPAGVLPAVYRRP